MLRSPYFINKSRQVTQTSFITTTSAPLLATFARNASEKPAAATATDATGGEKKKEGFLNETKKEKLVLGALGATATSTSVIAVCHLFVCQVPPTVAFGSVAGAALTGALGVFEGEGSGGTGFGSAIGIFLGCVGAWYAKSSNEPWSKTPAKK